MLGVPRVKATRVAPFPPAAAAPLFGEVSGADATAEPSRSDSRGWWPNPKGRSAYVWWNDEGLMSSIKARLSARVVTEGGAERYRSQPDAGCHYVER